MPRILHLVHVFPPECRGGTETYAEALARSQHASGHAVRVICGSEKRLGDQPVTSVQDGINVTRLPDEFGSRTLHGACADVTRFVMDDVARHPRDLVHLHHWHHLSNDLVQTLTQAKIPVVVSLSDLYASCPLFFRLPDLRTLCPSETTESTCVTCLSHHAKSDVEFLRPIFAEWRRSIRRELESASIITVLSHAQRLFLEAIPTLAGLTLEVLPYPSPVTAGRARGPRIRGGSEPLQLVSWGGLVPGKGLHTLVEAATRLRNPSDVAIHHFGTILDEAYRDDLVADHRNVRITFHGRFGREDLAERFSGFDVAVFPSLYFETHGLVVDEAVHLGLPVIVSDRGAPQERIGERGFVVPAGDPDALARRIQSLLDDPSLLERAREAPIPPLYDMARHAIDVARVYGSIQPMFAS